MHHNDGSFSGAVMDITVVAGIVFGKEGVEFRGTHAADGASAEEAHDPGCTFEGSEHDCDTFVFFYMTLCLDP